MRKRIASSFKITPDELLLYAFNTAIAYDVAASESDTEGDPNAERRLAMIAEMERASHKVLTKSCPDLIEWLEPKPIPWPDRVGIGLCALIFILIAVFIACVTFVTRNVPGPSDLSMAPSWAKLVLEVELVLALPGWAIARVVDFVAGGSQKRRQSN